MSFTKFFSLMKRLVLLIFESIFAHYSLQNPPGTSWGGRKWVEKNFSLLRKLLNFCPSARTQIFPYDSQIPGTSWGGRKYLLRNFSLLRKDCFYLESPAKKFRGHFCLCRKVPLRCPGKKSWASARPCRRPTFSPMIPKFRGPPGEV